MDTKRKSRYLEKIEFIIKNLDEIDSVLPDPTGIVLKGVFYNLSSAIEATMDMIAMICKDNGVVPSGDYNNINCLVELNVISRDLSENLIKCNGLRNFLVHQYNGINPSIVIKSIPDVKRTLKRFIKIVEELILGS